MATAWIREYDKVGTALSGGGAEGLPIAQEPGITDQTVTFVASVPSAAFNDQTRYVAIKTSDDAQYQVGPAPEATATSFPIAAGETVFFGVQPGHQVAFIVQAA